MLNWFLDLTGCLQEEDAEEVAAQRRLDRLGIRNSLAQSSEPPGASSTASSTGGGMARQSGASTSGRHSTAQAQSGW